MPTFYGPPSDGTVIPEQLENALAADIGAPGSKLRDALDAAGLGAEQARYVDPALASLFAGYTLRTAQPVGVVYLGSSTTEGSDQAAADRWVNKLTARMQAAYPSGTGSESTVGVIGTQRRTAPGIHGYNGGLSGTTATNYLTDGWVAEIGALAPRAIMHMVGSNDYNEQMPLATYRANMVAWLDKLDAACPAPVVHVLVQAHRRGGPVNPITWAEYGQVLEDLARERANCAFVDNSAFFEAVGVPDTDPLDLLADDLVHLTATGHDLTYRLLAEHLHVGAPVGGGGASGPVKVPPPSSVVTSDSFNAADSTDITGRVMDNYLGGAQSRTWSSDPAGQLGITGGKLTRAATNSAYFAGVEMQFADYETSFVVTKINTDGDLLIPIRRATGALAGSPDDYRLTIRTSGLLEFSKRVAGTVTSLGSTGTTIVAGDRVGLRAIGSKIMATVNGVVVATVTDTSNTGPGWTGVSGTANTTGWQLDNMTIAAALA